ncbi:12771_t:CDS:2 [Gigaspora margarita]|uniref:12771_t:CDS:1 n=1 Tax=Gigaspora margarita TaxID=4874 RepID=A0ABN7UNF4_GIGMA|nr:12771_t:CDS:2 [Gigaspora margarita]
MPRVSDKVTIRERVSCRGPALPKEIITEYFKEYENKVKELRVYGIVVSELNVAGRWIFKIRLEEIEENIVLDILAKSLNIEEFLNDLEEFSSNSESSSEDYSSDNSNKTNSSIRINWKEKPITIDPREVNLAYTNACRVNILSINFVSLYTLFFRYLPLNYIEQYVILSINIHRREKPFAFNRWMSLKQFEQILSYHILMTPYELRAPNLSNLLYSVCSFIDTFNNNLVKAMKPKKTLYIDESMNTWLVLADSSTNIITQLEPCEDKEIEKKQFAADYGSTAAYVLRNFHVKKRRGWPLNYPCNMIQKLKTTYRSFISKVAIIDDVYLIAVSLQNQKLQCIIATASTTANEEEVT